VSLRKIRIEFNEYTIESENGNVNLINDMNELGTALKDLFKDNTN
jgi:hypothetical protein